VHAVREEHLRRKALAELRRRRVSRASPEPLYLQATRSIEAILGWYQATRPVPIPPETELAAALGIGRPTVRQALAQLQQAGRVYAQRGVGTFAAPAVLSRPARLTSLYDDLHARGLEPLTRLLELRQTVAEDRDAIELEVAPGTPLIFLRRVRSASGKPVALLENVLNLHGQAPPEPVELERVGLYSILSSHYGVELRVASLQVSARLASREERKLLALPNPCAVLVGRRLAFDSAGRGVEIGTTIYAEGATIDGIRLDT
jgi:DNA-binding GntR family transcriptional regulator